MSNRIGIDSIEISRIEKSIQSPTFINRVYGSDELNELKSKGFPAQSAAACFCAKEAFSKAVGTGISGFSLNEVQTLHKENGKPYLLLSGDAKKTADNLCLDFDISITHTDSVATAVVIAFGKKGD